MRRIVVNVFHRMVTAYGQVLQRHRAVLVMVTQLVLIALANFASFALRFDGDIPPLHEQLMWQGLPFVLVIYGLGLMA